MPVDPDAPLLTPVVVRLFSGRSGSTLLMRLLASSPEVVVDRVYPYENRYLAYLLHLVRPMAEAHDPAGSWQMADLVQAAPGRYGPLPFEPLSVDRGDLQRRAVRALWEAFSAAAATRAPHARYYAEKIPCELDLVVDAGLPVRVINLVRDPRDVFASVLSFDERRGFSGFGRQAGQSDLEYVETWCQSVRKGAAWMFRELPGTDVTWVRYEDLALDLAGAAERLGQWLDTPLSAASVDDDHTDRAHRTTASAADSIGRWRQDLDPALVARLEALLEEELVALGYPPEPRRRARLPWRR
jgi:hypothetical protein